MGAYTEIVDFTFTAAETSRTFSGLSITKDDFVKVVITNTGTTDNFLFPNNNTTSSNYHIQTLGFSGSSVENVGRFNANSVGFTTGGTIISYIKLSENDRYNVFSNSNQTNSSNVLIRFTYMTSSGATFTNGITSLTFTAGTSNGIGTGSRIQIYKLAAEKVADITVASNTTQVDISNLSIDKDSEYLLVSDIGRNVSGAGGYDLFVNDNTTQSNYFSQNIFANDSSANADRINRPLAFVTVDATNSLAYSHIKLSNIGSYTSQNYTLRNVGESTLRIQNFFISSTAQNITSITKINIKAEVTNAIKTGSRFTLYKLYE